MNNIMNYNRILDTPHVTCEDWMKSRVKNTIEQRNKNIVESRCTFFVGWLACGARLKNHRGRCPLHGTLVIALGRGTCVVTVVCIPNDWSDALCRARVLPSRQEAGAAGDELPARFRAARSLVRSPELPARVERTCPSRGRRKRGGGCNDGRDDREEWGRERREERVYNGGHVRRAEAASHFGGESRIQPPRMCLHVPGEDWERTGDSGRRAQGMESMRSLYSARQKRLVRYTP